MDANKIIEAKPLLASAIDTAEVKIIKICEAIDEIELKISLIYAEPITDTTSNVQGLPLMPSPQDAVAKLAQCNDRLQRAEKRLNALLKKLNTII